MCFKHSPKNNNIDAGIDDAKMVDGRELHVAYEFARNVEIDIVRN
jgi:hypothetical protein